MTGPRRSTVARSGAVGLLGASVVVGTARRARTGRVGAGEERVFRWFNDRTDRISIPAWVVMQSGSLGAVFVVAGALARRRPTRMAVLTGLYGTAIWGAVKLVKPGVRRGRPDEYLEKVNVRGRRQAGLGYPSGHAAVSLAVALMVPRALGLPHRPLHDVAALGVGGVTAAARMYVGAHLPHDVAGGLAIGALAGGVAGRALARQHPQPGR